MPVRASTRSFFDSILYLHSRRSLVAAINPGGTESGRLFPSRLYCRPWNHTRSYRRSGSWAKLFAITTGREFHPAPENNQSICGPKNVSNMALSSGRLLGSQSLPACCCLLYTSDAADELL